MPGGKSVSKMHMDYLFKDPTIIARFADGAERVILEEIATVEDTPDEHIHILLVQGVWGNHPIGRSILGTHDTVNRFDADTIKEYFGRAYQPERIVIAVNSQSDKDVLH